MDLFEKWINNKDSEWIKRALVDPSFKSYKTKGIRKNNPEFNELRSILVNSDLATLGDAIIKFIYSEYFLDKVEKLTEEKAKVESDKCFVEKVAKHYDLLKYINKDPDDINLPNDYIYLDTPGVNKNRHKYIATCVEAVIGAIYKETGDLNSIKELVISWLKF